MTGNAGRDLAFMRFAVEEMFPHLLCCQKSPPSRVDLRGRVSEKSQTIRRKQVIQVFDVLKIMLQNVGDILINAPEADFGRSSSCFLEQLIVKLVAASH